MMVIKWLSKIYTFSLKRLKVSLVPALLFLSFALVLTFGNKTNAQENGAQLLVSNGKNNEINLVSFQKVEYQGSCPGIDFYPSTRNAKFVSL